MTNRKFGVLPGLLALVLTATSAALLSRVAAAAGTQPQMGGRSHDLKVVEITARRFEFSPAQVTLKKGEPVILRLRSEDVTHGFFVRSLKLDVDIPAGKSVDVKVTPETVGQFTTICDHFCGANHANMHMMINVIE